MLRPTIAMMIAASVCSPTNTETAAVAPSSSSSGLLN